MANTTHYTNGSHVTQVEDIQEIGGELGDESKLKTPTLNVDIKASFPQSEIFGVKLVNGHPTKAVLDVSNNEPGPVTVAIIGGSLLTPQDIPGAPAPAQVLRNLTAARYGLEIPSGEQSSVTYTFATDMHPQDVRLNIAAILQNSEGAVFTKMVFNETVTVVEAPFSIFDPQVYVPTQTSLSPLPLSPLTLVVSASSSTSSSPPPSQGRSTSSTIRGSQHFSLKSAAVARVASELSAPRAEARKLTLLIRSVWSVPMGLLLLREPKRMMRVGSLRAI